MPEGLTQTAAATVRLAARNGHYRDQTSGAAPGFVQANIAILPARQAQLFAEFCALNAQACPVLAMGEPGNPALPTLGQDIDIRHDLPRYRVYRDGVLTEAPDDVAHLWRDDLVTFAIGCSFTFEHALMEQGLELRHIRLGRNVAMYRTTIPTKTVGPFGGPIVVSMRPFVAADVARAVQISGRFPQMHGAPVHHGDPACIGIADLARPDYGDAVPVEPNETPLFWACGVTSQAALQQARLPLFLAHAPGYMLLTDLPHHAYEVAAPSG
ncbi:MAG TPA: putative hydro-lyase [Rhodopila sp.]|nr:putative hydro-lyase [Rhodopila sp.]